MEYLFKFEEKNGKKVTVCHGVTEKGNVFIGKAICSAKDDFTADKGVAISAIKSKKAQLERVMSNCMRRTALFEQKMLRETREADRTAEKIMLLDEELAKYD